MDNIYIIYKILKAIESSMDCDEFDYRLISADALGVSENRRLYILRMLIQAGLIDGICVDVGVDGSFMVSKGRPMLTIKGIEYLAENSLMQRAMKMAKGIKDMIPGI